MMFYIVKVFLFNDCYMFVDFHTFTFFLACLFRRKSRAIYDHQGVVVQKTLK
jgi:hypothetical protein